MAHAIIQGDFHGSSRDVEVLRSRKTDQTEAIFLEGRSQNAKLKHHNMSYIMFLLGYLVYEGLLRLLDIVGKLIPRSTNEDDHSDLDSHSNIDAELHEIWELSESRGRRVFFVATVLFFILSLIEVQLKPLVALMTLGTPFLFFGSVGLVSLGRAGIRDKIMAESINEISAEKDYDEVLILCGDSHVPGVVEELEEYGWEVTPKRSVHPVSRLLRMTFE